MKWTYENGCYFGVVGNECLYRVYHDEADVDNWGYFDVLMGWEDFGHESPEEAMIAAEAEQLDRENFSKEWEESLNNNPEKVYTEREVEMWNGVL